MVGVAIATACSSPSPRAIPATDTGSPVVTAAPATIRSTFVRREVLVAPIADDERLWPTPVWSGQDLFVAAVARAGTMRLLQLDPRANHWRASSPAPFNARGHLVSVLAWSGSEVLVAAAPSPPDGSAVAQQYALYAYDPTAEHWRGIAAPPPELRLPLFHWTGSELLALGGSFGATATDAASYSVSSNTWRPIEIPPFAEGSATLGPSRGFTVGKKTFFLMGYGERLIGLLYDADSGRWSWHATRAVESNTRLAFAQGDNVIVARRGVDEAIGRVDIFDMHTGQWLERRDTRFGDGPQICGARALPVTSGAIVSFCSRLYDFDVQRDSWTTRPSDSVQAELPQIVAAEIDGSSYAFEWDPDRDIPILTRLTVVTR